MNRSSPDEQRLDELLADFLRRQDSGEPLDCDAFLQAHPQHADSLRELLEADRAVQKLAGPTVEEETRGYDPSRAATCGLDPGADASQPSSPQIELTNSGQPTGFGNYQLIEIVGRGGMGVVYRAQQLGLERMVAVKMILNSHLASDADIQRFFSEAKAAANIHHRNVVQIYEIGEHQGQRFFSMELVEGCDLSDLIRQGDLDSHRIATLMRRAAAGVQAAHEQGVLHRDLKPSNILVAADDRVIVTDFGLAWQMSAPDERLTATGATLGTPSYMSPEQAAGDRVALGPASDVYALGAVLYAMLTRRPPHQGKTAMDTLLNVIHQPAAHPRVFNPAADRSLCRVCLKCLEKEPSRRYASAAELIQDLDRFLEGQPVLAQEMSSLGRASQWVRQVPLVAALTGRPLSRPTPAQQRAQAAIVLLVLLACVLAVTLPQMRRIIRNRMPAHVRLSGGAPGGMYDQFANDLATALQAAPGCQSATASASEASGANRQRLLDGDTHLALLQAGLVGSNELAVIAPVFHERVHVVVRKDGPLRTFAQLRGKNVAVGPAGSGMEHSAAAVLADLAAVPRSVAFTNLLTDATLEAAVVTIGADNRSLRELAATGKYRLLELPPQRIQRLTEDPRFRPTQISAEEFRAMDIPEQGLATVGTPAFLACRRDAPDRLVEVTLQALYPASPGRITRREASRWLFVPLHPVARKYFEDGPPQP